MFDHVMLDLETLDNSPTSAIVSIGAVKFDLDRRTIGDDFYRIVTLDSALAHGSASASTIKWWMQQEDAAREVFNPKTQEHVVSLPVALQEFSDWLERTGKLFDYKIWGNGAAFDNVIMRHAYNQCDLETPWQFWNDRCYRTLKGMYPAIRMVKRVGTFHNAKDDAYSQVHHLFDIMKALP